MQLSWPLTIWLIFCRKNYLAYMEKFGSQLFGLYENEKNSRIFKYKEETLQRLLDKIKLQSC